MPEFWNGRLPSLEVILYAVLSAAIPWCVYRINQALHRHGDPAWKTLQTETEDVSTVFVETNGKRADETRASQLADLRLRRSRGNGR